MDYDIALLKTSSPLNMNLAYPIEVLTQNSLLRERTMITVTGWGRALGVSSTKVLQMVSVPIYNQKRCSGAYPGKITPRMFCAGYFLGGKDSCNGIVDLGTLSVEFFSN